VMTIPSDISTFMTVLLFPRLVHETHYTRAAGPAASPIPAFFIYLDRHPQTILLTMFLRQQLWARIVNSL
jgi:hypothetical protein